LDSCHADKSIVGVSHMLQGHQTFVHAQTLSYVWCKVSPRTPVDGKAQENKKNQEGRPKLADEGPKEENVESREDEGTDYEASKSIWR
jgi:hypothetical protein